MKTSSHQAGQGLAQTEKMWQGGSMIKTMADWLEKISAGSMLVGLFQDDKGFGAIPISLAALVICLYFRRKERNND